ncbi:MAG: choice-of-anchor D domain-containing protein [Limisphaerales bacterium]
MAHRRPNLNSAIVIGGISGGSVNLINGVSSNNFGTVVIGTNTSLTFTVTNSGNANLTGLAILIDGLDAASFVVTTNPAVVVNPSSNTTFTVRFAPLTSGVKTAYVASGQ